MDQSANLAIGVSQIWNADADLPTLVPGGLVFGTEYDGALYPYAVLKIKMGLPMHNTGPSYAIPYEVFIETYAKDSSTVAANAQALQARVALIFPVTLKFEAGGSNPWNGNSAIQTIHVQPLPTSLDEEPNRKLGAPVLVTRNRFRVLLREQLTQ